MKYSNNAINQFLLKSQTGLQSQRRTKRRYHAAQPYMEGDTEEKVSALRTQNTVADAVDALETSAQVQVALLTLSETQQRRIRLYYYSGINKREIAEMEGVSHQAVSGSIKKALRILKNILK